MREPQDRDLVPAQKLSRSDATMAGDDHIVIVNQCGVVEAKPRNAVGNLLDLPATMCAGVGAVGHELADRDQFDATILVDITQLDNIPLVGQRRDTGGVDIREASQDLLDRALVPAADV